MRTLEVIDQEYCSVVSGVEQGQMQVVVVDVVDVNYATFVDSSNDYLKRTYVGFCSNWQKSYLMC